MVQRLTNWYNRIAPDGRISVYVFVWLAIVAAFALSVIGWAAYDATQKINREIDDRTVAFQTALEAIETARAERVRQLNDINKQQCNEIESLKKQNRDEAIEDFNDLERNAEILQIPFNERLQEIARQERDETLARNKPGTCPRKELR